MDHPSLTFSKGAKLPQFDLPIDYIVYDNILADLLKYYASYPCKIYACVFCFVAQGSVKATINLWDYEIKANDFVIVMPGSFIQIKDVSDDTRICFYGYSSQFLKKMNFWKAIAPIMLDVFKNPVFPLTADMGEIFRDGFVLATKASTINSFHSAEIAHSMMNIL